MEIPTDTEFCPDHDDMFLALMRLLPTGRAWQSEEFSFDRDTVLKQFVSGIALSFLNLEEDSCQALNEWFCFASTIDKDAWELDYGIPDECDLYNASVCAKVSAQHSISAEALLQLLEANGYVATGRWLTGSDPEFPGVYSTFYAEVNSALSPAFDLPVKLTFPLGAGRRLGHPDLAQIQCMLERYIPAHCDTIVELGPLVFDEVGSSVTAAIGAGDELSDVGIGGLSSLGSGAGDPSDSDTIGVDTTSTLGTGTETVS